MASSSNSRSLKYSTDYSIRSQGVVERMSDICMGFINNDNVSEFPLVHELWPHFPTISLANFNSISPSKPCNLAGVNTEPRGILKQISDQPNITWTDLENFSDPL